MSDEKRVEIENLLPFPTEVVVRVDEPIVIVDVKVRRNPLKALICKITHHRWGRVRVDTPSGAVFSQPVCRVCRTIGKEVIKNGTESST